MTEPGGAYARSGVDTGAAASGIGALVAALGRIDPGRPRRSILGSGHYASVLALDDSTAIAICTDGVGTKLIVAEQARRFDTVGIDCVAMNVNDLVCVGAEPIAMVDYIAVEQVDPRVLAEIGESLRAGAERAGIEIPGGELAQVPEMLQGHPSPHGVDLVGAAIGVVPRDRGPDRGGDRARRRRDRACRRAECTRTASRSRDEPSSTRAACRSTTRLPSWGAPWPRSCSSRRRSTFAPRWTCCARKRRFAGLRTSPATGCST